MTAPDPLYKLQQRALTDKDAAYQCGAHYAKERKQGTTWGGQYERRVVLAWVRGFHREPNPYNSRRGGNFAADFRRAYDAGRQLRETLEMLRRADEQESERRKVAVRT